jgi:Cu/Ag efflux pump CusA
MNMPNLSVPANTFWRWILFPSRNREEQLEELREAMADIPGIVTAVEQPISHLISHMLSGVKAQIGIKIFGDDLEILRRKADEVKT